MRRDSALSAGSSVQTEGGSMKPEDCVLFSGAANGAETAFGAAAERHGVGS